MSYLQKILLEVKSGLSACETIPESRWAMIASMCGPAELEELHERNSRLQSDLLVVEDWDGDTGMRFIKQSTCYERLPRSLQVGGSERPRY